MLSFAALPESSLGQKPNPNRPPQQPSHPPAAHPHNPQPKPQNQNAIHPPANNTPTGRPRTIFARMLFRLAILNRILLTMEIVRAMAAVRI
jgi:hypothetical protein